MTKFIRRIHLYIPLAFVLLGILGCPGDKPAKEMPDFSEVILSYKGGAVTAGEFVRICSEFESRDSVRAIALTETQWAERLLYRQMMDETMAELARADGLDQSAEYAQWREDALKKEMIENYIKDKVDLSITISKKDLEKEYKFNKSAYEIPLTYRFNQVWIDSEKWGHQTAQNRAKQALAYLKAGRDAKSVIVEFSDRSPQDRLKPLGDYKKGELPYPELEKAALETPIGEYSGIVETPLGFHIVLPEVVNEGKTLPLEQVESEVRDDVFRKKVAEKSERLFKDLSKKYGAVIRPDLLSLPKSEEGRVILEVGDVSMTLGQFRALVKSVGADEQLEALQMMSQRMMAKEAAEEEHYLSSEELDKDMELYEVRSLAKLYTKEQSKESGDVTEEEIDAFYRSNNRSLYHPTEIDSYEIVIKAKIRPDMMQYEKIMAMKEANMEALFVRDQIMNGMPFPVAAQMYSSAPSRNYGGELPRRSPGTGRRFDNAAFALEEGEVSEPVELSDGYQLIWVTKIYERYLPEKEEVRDKIIDEIVNSRRIQKDHELSQQIFNAAEPKPDPVALKKWEKYVLDAAADPIDWIHMLK